MREAWLRDASTGKRPQLPTIRHLPPRRQAIEHAWDKGLITEEEHVGAISEPKRPKRTDFFFSEDVEEEEVLSPFPSANTA
jgi:hypothetical protein